MELYLIFPYQDIHLLDPHSEIATGSIFGKSSHDKVHPDA